MHRQPSDADLIERLAELGTRRTWVAVDPSLTRPGFALIDPFAPPESLLLCTHSTTFHKDASDAMRVGKIAGTLNLIWRMTGIERVIVEVPSSLYVPRGRSVTALKPLMVCGAVMAMLGYRDVPVHAVRVEDWKGPGHTGDKTVSLELAWSLWPNHQFANDDEAEAALLGMWAVLPDQTTETYQLRVVGVAPKRAIERIELASEDFRVRDEKRYAQAVERLQGLNVRLRSKGGKRGGTRNAPSKRGH